VATGRIFLSLDFLKFFLPLSTFIVLQIEENLKTIIFKMMQLIDEEANLSTGHRELEDPIRELENVEIPG
jgi:hypothetical protein